VLGTPLFKKVTMTLENGKQVIISAPDNNDQNKYVQQLMMNGKVYDKNWISHFDLLNGGTLNYKMGSMPNKTRGVTKAALPFSLSNEQKGF
jgi:putative alpha-1,2-mannosidase